MMRVNVGSGHTKIRGWINVDVDEDCNPEVLGSATDLPFKDNTVDRIFFGHVLEHLDYTDAQTALHEAWRVLRDGGELGVISSQRSLVWTMNTTPTALVLSVFPNAYNVPVDRVMRWTGWPNDVPHSWHVAILANKGGLTEDEKEAGRQRALAFMKDEQ